MNGGNFPTVSLYPSARQVRQIPVSPSSAIYMGAADEDALGAEEMVGYDAETGVESWFQPSTGKVIRRRRRQQQMQQRPQVPQVAPAAFADARASGFSTYSADTAGNAAITSFTGTTAPNAPISIVAVRFLVAMRVLTTATAPYNRVCVATSPSTIFGNPATDQIAVNTGSVSDWTQVYRLRQAYILQPGTSTLAAGSWSLIGGVAGENFNLVVHWMTQEALDQSQSGR